MNTPISRTFLRVNDRLKFANLRGNGQSGPDSNLSGFSSFWQTPALTVFDRLRLLQFLTDSGSYSVWQTPALTVFDRLRLLQFLTDSGSYSFWQAPVLTIFDRLRLLQFLTGSGSNSFWQAPPALIVFNRLRLLQDSILFSLMGSEPIGIVWIRKSLHKDVTLRLQKLSSLYSGIFSFHEYVGTCTWSIRSCNIKKTKSFLPQ